MKRILAGSVLLLLVSCAGTRRSGEHYTTHAESLNILSIPFFGNDYDQAWSRIPEGAVIHTVTTTPRDWTSLRGILNRLLGITSTQISWTKDDPLVPRYYRDLE